MILFSLVSSTSFRKWKLIAIKCIYLCTVWVWKGEKTCPMGHPNPNKVFNFSNAFALQRKFCFSRKNQVWREKIRLECQFDAPWSFYGHTRGPFQNWWIKNWWIDELHWLHITYWGRQNWYLSFLSFSSCFWLIIVKRKMDLNCGTKKYSIANHFINSIS